MANDILIVDDEEDIRELVAGILSDEGHAARTARNADEALAAIATRRPHLVFLDIWLQGSRLDGLQVLEAIQKLHRSLPVVMISGHGNIETAVSAIKMGAYDFIEKPFKADRLVLVAERALEAYKLRREVSALRQRAGFQDRIVGSSMPAHQLQAAVARLAPVKDHRTLLEAFARRMQIHVQQLHAVGVVVFDLERQGRIVKPAGRNERRALG